MQNHDHYTDDFIRGILTSVKTIALVGASINEARPSNSVMRFLLAKGYHVIPVNPGQAGKRIHDQPVDAHLADIPEPIDMVDVFRNSFSVPSLVDEILALKVLPRIIWMQLGVQHEEAARRAEAAGISVVMNRCPAIEYPRLGMRAA